MICAGTKQLNMSKMKNKTRILKISRRGMNLVSLHHHLGLCLCLSWDCSANCVHPEQVWNLLWDELITVFRHT